MNSMKKEDYNMDEIREKTITVKTPYSDEEIKDYTEKVIKKDIKIMKKQNNYLEAFLSEIGNLQLIFSHILLKRN